MINFPGLNLSFSINPVALTVFGVNIYWYANFIVLGICLALGLMYKSKEKFGISFEFLLETMIYAIIVGVIGARSYYVIFNLENYIANPFKIFALRDGGLAIFRRFDCRKYCCYCKMQKIQNKYLGFF